MANQNQNQRNQKRQQEDFSLKETTPNINAGRVISGDRLPTAFDLVEKMHFLFARVVKAKDLPNSHNCFDTCNPYVEVKVGTLVGKTRFLEKTMNPEWNQVIAFSKEKIQCSVLEIMVKENNNVEEDPEAFIGRVTFGVYDVPMRVPPDSPLAPQWYQLEDRNGVKVDAELMVSVWMGTQADEAFSDALHSDAAASDENIAYTRSKVYISPRFCYLRVNVIQAENLMLLKNKNNNSSSDFFIQAVLGNLALRSRPVKISKNPMWNEDLMFVAAEPFEESLLLSIEIGTPQKHESLGRCVVHLKDVEKRIDERPVESVWYDLENPNVPDDGGEEESNKVTSRLNLRTSLDGGYHVLDEATHHSSDLSPSSRDLWQPSIGVLELGILSAIGLSPMKKDNRTDAYCVAKYGPKWVRTRTIVDSLSPKWNEQYTWEVFDPCTVITIVVFDNGHLPNNEGALDKRIGKVRIRLSTLETNRIYTHSYPLINLHTQGVRKMGEIQLAVRFSCPSLINVLQTYAQPMLPRMHYVSPLSIFQLDSLRSQAAAITTLRLRRAEPPLTREVVEFMLDVRENVWSMRRGRAQFHRIAGLLDGFLYFLKMVDEIQSWKSSFTTISGYIAILIIILLPGMVLPTIFSYLLMVGIWRYRTRPRYPSHMDMKISHAHTATCEELEEEFDTFPSRFTGDNLKKRYDRLRGISGRVLAVMGDLATQGERVQSLLSWRDPRATALFIIFCFVAAIVTYAVPLRSILIVLVSYLLRPPRLRIDMPAFPQNFLRRMPENREGKV